MAFEQPLIEIEGLVQVVYKTLCSSSLEAHPHPTRKEGQTLGVSIPPNLLGKLRPYPTPRAEMLLVISLSKCFLCVKPSTSDYQQIQPPILFPPRQLSTNRPHRHNRKWNDVRKPEVTDEKLRDEVWPDGAWLRWRPLVSEKARSPNTS